MALLFEEKIKKVKEDIKADDKLFENKPRYGLFSYTPNYGSEFGLQPPAEGRRDAKGNVRLDPKNFLTKKIDFFSKTGYLCESIWLIIGKRIISFVASKFVDTGKMNPFRSVSPSSLHKKAFKTVSGSDTLSKTHYAHMSGQDIDVKTGFGKRGMYAAGNSNYGHLFSKPFEYISDPYENKRNQELRDKESDKKKRVGKKDFVNSSQKKDFFTSHRDTYYSPKRKSESDFPEEVQKFQFSSKKAFVPSSPGKIGFNRTMNKFPEYMSSPLPSVTPQKNKKELIWRYNYNELSKPSPSVTKYNEKFRPRGNL